jgi:hypothetical protein
MPLPHTAHSETETCRLCGAESRLAATQQVLYRYSVGYYQCPTCDLLQTQRPFWLDEAYGSALSSLDTGAVSRTMLCTQLTRALAALLRISADDPCIDYGGGHGILTRAMRDQGYDFRWHDKYAQNHFARGFEAQPQARHALLTCFEVWEHLADPGRDLSEFFAPAHDFLLISTYLHHGHRENWWYYSCESGQHVAFFSDRTMRFVARRFGYEAVVCQRYTLFCKPGLLSGWRRAAAKALLGRAKPQRNSRIAPVILALSRPHRSRTWDDHVDLMSRERPRAAVA